MRDLFPEHWKRSIKRFLLGLDAWIDFSLFRSASGARESYERFSTFMDRFHVSGWRRWLNELLSEGATLGAFGLVVLSKRLDTLARVATVEAILLDEQEAPQREIERRQNQTEESRVQQETARRVNKATFRP